jgi:hypothetical protein
MPTSAGKESVTSPVASTAATRQELPYRLRPTVLAGRVRPNRAADPRHRPDPATSDGALRPGSRNTLRQGPGVHAGGKKVAGERRRGMGARDDRPGILGRRFGVSRRLCVPATVAALLTYTTYRPQIFGGKSARSNTGVFSILPEPVPAGLSSVACRNASVSASSPSTVSFA